MKQILAAAIVVMMVEYLPPTSVAGNWPEFRGPNCAGTTADARPPVKIGPSNNVAWTVEIPWSPSSPCTWEDRIFLTTFSDGQLETRAHDAKSGKLLWSVKIKPERLEPFHSTDGSPAAATPATDGKRVVSYFNSFGLICYDVAGKELWRHPLPMAVIPGGYGSGTSPVLAGNRILLNRDQDGNSSLLAVDLETGKTVWESPRPDAIGSFGTPIVWKNEGAEEVVMPGSVALKGYALKDGKERWVVEGLVGLACTTPVLGDGLLFFAGWSPGQSDAPWPSWETFLERNDKNHDGVVTFDEFDPVTREYIRGLDRDHDGKLTKADWDALKARAAKAENALVAVKPGGLGDITTTHVAWKATRGLPYVPSPLFYQDRIYLIRDGGMMSSYNAKTGESNYVQERLEAADKYYASPVAADGRIYLASLAGKVTVVKAGGEKPEMLHQADFADRIFATPALSGRRLYLRTQHRLFAFEEKSQ